MTYKYEHQWHYNQHGKTALLGDKPGPVTFVCHILHVDYPQTEPQPLQEKLA
jgi:hypothetical protein